MTAAPDTHDAQAVDLAIIGGGSVGVSLLLQFLLSLPAGGGRPLSLRLYEPQERPGPGGAYQDDLRSNLLNIPAGNMSALADERLDFVDWLRRQDPAWLAGHGVEGAIDPGDFLPRPLFGAYMADAYERARALAPSRGVTLEHVRARVAGVTPLASGRVRVLAESGQPCVARRVALCNGNLPSRAFPALAAAPGYFNSPYPVSELAAGIAADATVCVIGTSLSAVDAVVALQQAGHRGPLICVSRNGRLPSVRSPHNRPPPRGLTELSRDGAQALAHAHGGALTLEQIAAALGREVRALGGAVDAEDILGVDGDARTALDDEIRRSEQGARPWQAVAAATNAAVDLIWHLLPDAERARFQSQWRALWMARRANFPMRNARKLQALFRAGQLEVLSGYVDSRHDAAGGFVTRLRTPAGECELRSRYLINATSFSVDAAGAADPLVSALLRDGHGQAHPHGGLALDYATGSLLDAGGVVQPAITVLGSLAGGTYFWTTSMDVNARLARDQARRIAAALADAGATVPGSRRDTPCPGISPVHRPPRPAPAASSGPR